MRQITVIIILYLMYSCANQTAPTGGPKDEDPPILLSSNPQNSSLNFDEEIIELEFNEYVKLNNPNEQIIISPRVDQEYEVKLRKTKVLIEFEQSLSPNTTYTINFREAIQDITESNSPPDLKLSFSTGAYLDSLSISGSVTELLTDKVLKDYSILLYDIEDTTTVFDSPPLYFSKTNNEGFYQLENLRPGGFLIYAIEDKNKNLYLDMKSESYGFMRDTIWLDTAITNLNLSAQYLNAERLELNSDRQNGTIYELKYNKHITNYEAIYQIDSLGTAYTSFLDETRTTINIYQSFSELDSALLLLNLTDSLNNVSSDSVYVKFEETIREPSELKQNIVLEKIFPTDRIFTSQIEFNKPIISFNFDSIYLYLDSLNIIPIDTANYLTPNALRTKYNIQYTIDTKLFEEDKTSSKPAAQLDSTKKIRKEKEPHLYLGRGAFISIENDSSYQEQPKLKFDKIENYGLMLIEVVTTQPSYIVQLLDNNYNIIQSIENLKNFNFEKVKPGDYYIRTLIDTNQNQIWDPGDIIQDIEPEPIVYYKSEDGNPVLTIRANWELGPIKLQF